MAITINQSPSQFTPAYNDVVFVVTSTNKTQSNFKYVADIIIAGVSRRIKMPPNPTYGSCAFNVGRIVETYITSDISKSSYGFQQNTNSYIPFTVQFGEEYGPSSGTTIYPALTNSSTVYIWNSIFDFLPYKNYNQESYLASSGTTTLAATKKYLTNQPSTVDIRDNEDTWLYMMTNTSGSIYYANVKTYDSGNNVLGSYLIQNPFQAITSNNDRFVRFGSGTRNLNLIPSSGVISGSQPTISASVAKYTVQLTLYPVLVNVDSFTSVIQTYKVNNTCTKNVTYRFHFLNKLGGFDSFTFIRASTKTVNINRSIYKKTAGGLNSAASFNYSLSDRQDSQYDTSLKDNFKIESDWIDEPTSIWLEELVTSPEIYLDDPTYGLVSVNIKDSSYQIKQTAQDKLFNLKIEFEYSFNRYRQRR